MFIAQFQDLYSRLSHSDSTFLIDPRIMTVVSYEESIPNDTLYMGEYFGIIKNGNRMQDNDSLLNLVKTKIGWTQYTRNVIEAISIIEFLPYFDDDIAKILMSNINETFFATLNKLPVTETNSFVKQKRLLEDYVNKLSDVPIVNLIGTLTVPVKISSLDDGIYKVKGQCIIGGNNTTVQSSADDVLYLVSHDADTSSTTITKMQGKSITLYFIQQDGEYTTDRYVTESWINEQNFASADSVKEYVSNIIEETVLNVLDDHIDAALERKLGGIDSEDLTNIFQGGN